MKTISDTKEITVAKTYDIIVCGAGTHDKRTGLNMDLFSE